MRNLNQSSAASERKFSQTVVGLVALGFLAVLVACLGALLVMKRGQEHTSWVNHTYLVERHVSGIRLSLEEMRSSRRGMLLGMRETAGSRYQAARRLLEKEIAAVDELTQDNPLQQANVRELRAEAHVFDSLNQASLTDGAVSSFREEEQARLAAAQRLTMIAQRMLAEERQLLVGREAAQKSSLQTFYTVLGLVAVLLLVVGAASIWVILRYTRALARTRDELRQLNDSLEDAVKVRTQDLQRANEEIQRFAYIVSHDLRSPLVNVMGFTSELEAAVRPLSQLVEQASARDSTLVSNDARLAVEEDLPEALGFIRASTQKMDRLINAILRLSREGRRNIAPAAVELTPLATSIIDGIRHLVDERGARVDVQEGMPTVTTDRLALEQIISNLVENALKYQAPGRPSEIGVTAQEARGRVSIRIADNGRGIDPRDHERIFDLFRRSGTQDQPGEGIGLAHVRTLAYRLGGTIAVSSQLGEGATFTIDLPVVYTGDKERAA
jgi:signal transduction histidine kinase